MRCGKRDSLSAFRYNGSTYSSYTSNVPMATTAEMGADVGLQNENGILYYFSQYENGTGGYFLTQFINRTIELSFSTGESPTIIRYITTRVVIVTHAFMLSVRGEKQLPMNQFMRIQIAITSTRITIRISSADVDISSSPLELIETSISIVSVSLQCIYSSC